MGGFAGFTPVDEAEGRDRSERVNFRLTPAQAREFRDRAERSRMSMTGYFLKCCLDDGQGTDPAALDALFAALEGIREANARLAEMGRCARALEGGKGSVSRGVAAEALRSTASQVAPSVERAMLDTMRAIDGIRNSGAGR